VGFAILGQKQYTSALARYWAAVRAEVFQSSFVHFLYICFSIGQRFQAEVFQIPQHRKALSLYATNFAILFQFMADKIYSLKLLDTLFKLTFYFLYFKIY
jgi:hypothetical protein